MDKLIEFITERYRIYLRRKKGLLPWTRDKILARYKFCNVHRENDRTTRWIAEHWRDPHANYRDLWFAMIVARLINRPESLQLLSLPGRWNRVQFLKSLQYYHSHGGKVFSAAYIVSTGGKKMNKLEYLAEYVLNPVWQHRTDLRPCKGQTLQSYYELLREHNGLGSFIAAQIVADLKYVQPLRSAKDWWTFAASGPGSRRGLNRVLGRGRKEPWRESDWYAALFRLWKDTQLELKVRHIPPLHMQDLQNCLCEFDKYERTRLGEGRPKQNFTPHSQLKFDFL